MILIKKKKLWSFNKSVLTNLKTEDWDSPHDVTNILSLYAFRLKRFLFFRWRLEINPTSFSIYRIRIIYDCFTDTDKVSECWKYISIYCAVCKITCNAYAYRTIDQPSVILSKQYTSITIELWIFRIDSINYTSQRYVHNDYTGIDNIRRREADHYIRD